VSEGSLALGIANGSHKVFKSFSKRAPRVDVMGLRHAIGCSVYAEVFNAELVRCNVLKPEGEIDLRHKCPISRVIKN
jgi:hypothetical protein